MTITSSQVTAAGDRTRLTGFFDHLYLMRNADGATLVAPSALRR